MYQKNRDITLPTKFYVIKAMVFPVVTYGYESWTIKKAECRFQIVVLEKSPESPLDCKIKPVNPKRNQSKSSLEELMLKLKLQYFGHLM